jgi:ribokinase
VNRVAVIGLTGTSVFMRVPRFHTGGETIHADTFHVEYGGKGFNQAVAAARWNAEVSFLTAVGETDATPVRDTLADEGIQAAVVAKDGPSAYAAILTDPSGETRVTVYPGARLAPDDVDAFAPRIAEADILLLTNEVDEAVNLRAARIAAESGTRVILNPAPARPLPATLQRLVWLATPNEFENEGLEDIPEAVVTLGDEGCLIRSTGKRMPAPSFGPAVDTTGAGDTFNGVLAACLARGMDLEAAAAEANSAAARSVTTPYVLPAIPKAATSRP